MRKLLMAAVVGALVMTVAAVPAGAGPPDRQEINVSLDFPDFENGFVVFVNTTRDAVCTDEQVAAELALIEWFPVWGEAFFRYLDENMGDPTGFEGEFPPFEPPRPDGIDSFVVMQKVTGKGAIVDSARGSNVHIELWRQGEEPPGVGPCTDTMGVTEPFATGTGMARANDNDLEGSGTRGNAFGNHVVATLSTADGSPFHYHSRFHLNSRCHGGEFEPPSCLLEWTKLG